MTTASSVSRRDFLVGAGAAVFPIAPAAAAPILAPIPAIDTHTHFYDPTRPQGVPWPPKTETLLYRAVLPPHFAALTRRHNVIGTVIVEASAWVEDNQWILDLAKNHPLIVGFIGNLEPGKPEFAGNLARFAANPLFRGLRFGGGALASGAGQSSAFEADVRRMEERRLTLDVVGNSAMLPHVLRIAKLAPRLRIVIDHLPFQEWDAAPANMRAGIAELAQQTNVFAKVSHVPRREGDHVIDDRATYTARLDVLWDLFGEDRLVYGSNWPVSDRFAPYDVMYKIVSDYFMAKGRRAAEKYFWRNSHAAYQWVARGDAAKLLKGGRAK
ncbi:MAG: amidohydrolase family protein [Blastocatellia bacterium]